VNISQPKLRSEKFDDDDDDNDDNNNNNNETIPWKIVIFGLLEFFQLLRNFPKFYKKMKPPY